MSSFPTAFSDETRALNESLFDDGDAELIRKLAEKGYEVHAGLTRELADDISKMCQEPAIKEFCPNDVGKRFTDQESIERWLAKGRSAMLLLKREAGGELKLAGYGWSGSESSSHVPDGETTFAIRIGQEEQGQGLATSFARLIVASSTLLYGSKNMWLETWNSNGGAVHVYHKIGFEDVYQNPDERLTGSGDMVPDIRLYMTLPNELLPSVN